MSSSKEVATLQRRSSTTGLARWSAKLCSRGGHGILVVLGAGTTSIRSGENCVLGATATPISCGGGWKLLRQRFLTFS